MSEETDESSDGDVPNEESAVARSTSYADDLDDSLDPSAHEAEPSFDVTTGDDLVDRLPSGSEVPRDVKRSFWSTLFLLKIALLSLTGAVLFAVVRGELVAAGVLAAVGLLAGSRTLLKIRRFRSSETDE